MDRRMEILNTVRDDSKFANVNEVVFSIPEAKEAMDEYFTEQALELLEWMGNNNVKCAEGLTERMFYYKGEWINKQELFENFL